MEEKNRFKPGFYMDFHWQMSYANEKFNPEEYKNSASEKQLHLLRDHYKEYKDNPMDPHIVEYWNEIGVEKDFYPCDIETASSRREAHHYSVLRPQHMEDKKYPVIYFSHAGGQDAFDSEMCGLGEMIPKEQFIFVSPNCYGTKEFLRIISEVEQKYPVDLSRVYLMGFSGGSASSIQIGMDCPEKVAGIALMPGPNAFNQIERIDVPEGFVKSQKLRFPLICIGGDCDGSDIWPLVDEHAYDAFNMWMQNICKIPNYECATLQKANDLINTSDSKVEQVFGLQFHKAFITDCDDTYMYIGDYLEENGVTLARFCSVMGLPHEVYPRFVGTAWSFLKKFQRDQKEGELIYPKPEIDFRTRRSLRIGSEKKVDFSAFHETLILNEDGSVQPMDESYYQHTLIADNTWAIESDGCISYLLASDSEGILIDTGYGAGNIREYCEKLCGKPVKKVANTHAHFDHSALNGLFECAYMAEKCVPLSTIPFPSFKEGYFSRDYVVKTVKERDKIQFGNREIEVFEAPIHSEGDVLFLDQKTRILFSGDVLSGRELRVGTKVKQAHSYMEKLMARREEYDYIYGGHEMNMDASIVDSYEENLKYILEGHEGNIVSERKMPKLDLSKLNVPEGTKVYERNRPRPEDIPEKKPEMEYMRVMEYAKCKVEYDIRFN